MVYSFSSCLQNEDMTPSSGVVEKKPCENRRRCQAYPATFVKIHVLLNTGCFLGLGSKCKQKWHIYLAWDSWGKSDLERCLFVTTFLPPIHQPASALNWGTNWIIQGHYPVIRAAAVLGGLVCLCLINLFPPDSFTGVVSDKIYLTSYSLLMWVVKQV